MRPAEWDDELLGEWTPPMIENPACRGAPGCGPYSPPLIANPKHKDNYVHPRVRNPKYRGTWEAPPIDNPSYFYDPEPYKHWPNITALGFELWSVDGEIGFNNILLANDEAAVLEWNEENYRVRAAKQKRARSPPPKSHVEQKVVKSHSPIVLMLDAIGRIVVAWREMYAEAEVPTLILTGGVILLPFFLTWFCSRRRSRLFAEEEEADE